jgi:hypothetical protein
MNMIRNMMLGLSFLALTTASAVAAPMVHHTTTRIVAEDAPPADAKPAKKAKKAKKDKKADAPKDEKAPAEAK